MNRKVNLFIIGASKCGTTSLWSMLNNHTDVYMSQPKEPFFFSFSDYNSKYEDYYKFFERVENEKYMGEATPIYSETTLIPDLPNRLHKYNPDAKIIYLVRNPLDRLKSVWRQLLYRGHDRKKAYENYCDIDVPMMPDSFNKAIYEYPNFIEATKYWTHLKNYLKFFPKENLGVFFFEDLKDNPKSFFKDVCDFLEIDNYFIDEMSEVKNKSKGRKRDSDLMYKLKKNKTILKVGSLIKEKFNLSSDLFRKEIEYEGVTINGEEKNKILKILDPEIEGILNYKNKPSDFWKS